jgi:isoamylase
VIRARHIPTALPGDPYPFGATEGMGGFNFAIYIKEAIKVSLCLFNENDTQNPISEYVLDPKINTTGKVWHIFISELPPFSLYGFRVNGTIILDPYAKAVASHKIWNDRSNNLPYRPLGKTLNYKSFDWQGVTPPKIPSKDLIIYEMHVRGFTADPSSAVEHLGTYSGVIEKIPYLKELGINAVEFLPIFEFNEKEATQKDPTTHLPLPNYFGYSHVNFFAPMNRYAVSTEQDQALIEFKTMVRELHRNGIEVILDVVYNHTSEGGEKGPLYSFKGLDKHAYYMIGEKSNYYNFSGCGNTYNCNNPIAREVILSSLRYWVTDMHIDGFRFDLASILTRDENGTPLSKAPIVEAIAKDPILSNIKLIAEAWDAAGLYQVGSFYPSDRWSEWNGRYRDVVRKFIKGTADQKKAFATAISGSQDLYGWRNSPQCSINFVTAHDGFSLSDLVTYNEKHNYANGENNKDGFDHNESWNCGIEGHSSNKKIVELRERQIRNFVVALMVSQGIPMLLMGDEYAHSRDGNNNTWCQDNRLNWFLWNNIDVRPGFLRFYRSMIQLRKNTPLICRNGFLNEKDVTWHGTQPGKPEWENDNRFIAFTLNTEKFPSLYIAFHAGHLPITLTLPSPGDGRHWEWVVNTYNEEPNDFFDEGERPKVEHMSFRIHSYSSIILISIAN